ncbi:MAG TPA: class I SAM-dependent methyltransferase [Acidimicrobiales bacterium]|jgi:SAM-dependent methyltransferase|nr:class I SAM-dependent methyltransferase [Acidimicrobiales bacterium]
MNENHSLCSSTEWARYIGEEIVGRLADRIDSGARMLEIGPGPGAATGHLRAVTAHLTVLELDPAAARALEERYAGSDDVDVVVGDATAMDFAEASFDAVGAFTMLHHVPTVAAQDAILRQVFRVLRPGGVFVGSDSLPSTGLHDFHEADTYNPIEPGTWLTRLRTTGFTSVMLEVGDELVFAARKASAGASTGAAD